jgi:hypothetical protein
MSQIRPLAIDLFCGLGGWAEGFLSEGWDVIGFDVERHDYGTGGYPGQLVLQDVTTLDGSQFRNAAVIVASPPCQAYSYRAMSWKRAKALPPPDNTLFETCFRLQREAIEATSKDCPDCGGWAERRTGHECSTCNGTGEITRYIPLVVENVKGAQKWVGRAAWKYKSFHLWGDVPALMPLPVAGFEGFKGFKADWRNCEASRRYSSHSKERKQWSAEIAKIPFPLAQHIARVFKPTFHVEHPVSGP